MRIFKKIWQAGRRSSHFDKEITHVISYHMVCIRKWLHATVLLHARSLCDEYLNPFFSFRVSRSWSSNPIMKFVCLCSAFPFLSGLFARDILLGAFCSGAFCSGLIAWGFSLGAFCSGLFARGFSLGAFPSGLFAQGFLLGALLGALLSFTLLVWHHTGVFSPSSATYCSNHLRTMGISASEKCINKECWNSKNREKAWKKSQI